MMTVASYMRNTKATCYWSTRAIEDELILAARALVILDGKTIRNSNLEVAFLVSILGTFQKYYTKLF